MLATNAYIISDFQPILQFGDTCILLFASDNVLSIWEQYKNTIIEQIQIKRG